jgi:hypothetical protein
MSIWERIVEKKIQQAMQSGEFDDLPGEGRPLQLDDETFVPQEWRLAYRLLHNAHLLPDWLQLDREIAAVVNATRAELASKPIDPREGTMPSGDRLAAFEKKIDLANRMIDEYNLRVPIARLRRGRLDARAELAKLLEGGR